MRVATIVMGCVVALICIYWSFDYFRRRWRRPR
jgi:hypothetical protein